MDLINENTNIDARPAIWKVTPKTHSNGTGLFGRFLDLVEDSVEHWVRTKSYNEYRTKTPLLSEEQRNEIRSNIKPGDILLESDDRLLNWRIFEAVLGSTRSPRWNHTALYVGDGIVIEAGGKIPENVHRVSLNEFLETHHVMVGRCDDSDPKKTIDFVVARLGLPYNARFILTDVAYCCSELVAGALNAAAKIPGDIIVKSQRRPFYSGLCVSPADVLLSPKIDWWYKSSPSYFWKAVWSVMSA